MPHSCPELPVSSRFPRGFTLIEAVVALALAAIAGSVMLLGMTAAQQNVDEAMRMAVAQGMAEQLMDEILGQRYCHDRTVGYETTLGPSSWEAQGKGRERYTDIDDYNGVRTSPPKDMYGIALGKEDGAGGLRDPAMAVPGNMTDAWRQEVDVYYVSEANTQVRLATGQTSDYRAVEVRIVEDLGAAGTRELAKLRRVVAYFVPLK